MKKEGTIIDLYEDKGTICVKYLDKDGEEFDIKTYTDEFIYENVIADTIPFVDMQEYASKVIDWFSCLTNEGNKVLYLNL